LYDFHDQPNIDKELSEIAKAMEELTQDETTKKAFEEELDFDDDFIHRGDKEKSFGIFGINLNDISARVKNLIGFSFLGLLLLLVVYALKSLKKTENKKNKKKKEKTG
jgi:hypothetical protein